jgi:galactitol-specific phosphotransferase system IIC component
MSSTLNPFLRQVLFVDAVISGAAGLLMAAGAPFLAPLLGLPAGLLFYAGLALFPFVALLVVVARRGSASRLLLIDIIAINALWVAASFGLLVSGAVAPTLLGYAFVIAQALAVALLAALQLAGFRRTAASA